MNATLSSSATAIAALLVVLGLIWVGAYALRATRSAAPGTAGHKLTIHATLALDPKRRIYLIACENRRVLLLTGGGNDVVLGWLPPEPARGEPAP